MTKYILHGGVVRFQTASNKQYYQEMAKGFDQPSVLLVYFAREAGEWAELIERDKANFSWANPDRKFNFTVAQEADFVRQAKNCDVVCIAGGKTRKLLDALEIHRPCLEELFEGKTVAGSSAGAHVISEWFYGHSDKEVSRGFGLLPVTVFTHYHPTVGTEFFLPDNEVRAIEEQLISKSPHNQFVKLPEQHSAVFDQTFRV